MTTTPTFANPPIVEFALGVQFSPLTNFSTGHFGLFWNEIGVDDWCEPGDTAPIDDQFEMFDRPHWSVAQSLGFRLMESPPVGRFTVRHQSGDRMLQLQPSRFHLNWQKKGGFKPSYKVLIDDFMSMFERFQNFISSNKIGEVVPNQWELTYVDSFPHGEYWQTPADWSRILPGLFGELFPMASLGLKMEQRRANWSFEIEPKLGRIHLTAQPGRWSQDQRDSLLLSSTARGPIPNGDNSGLRAGLDLGHEKSVGTFLKIVDNVVQERWN